MIEKFLNQRNSTRNLSDDEFNDILSILTSELKDVDFTSSFSSDSLLLDWKRLIEFQSNNNFINSTSRLGMKLCEHFFPNFYDIEDAKGNSFRKLWKNEELLQKVLRWNRKSHSTPYLSELKRGIYFCGGLPKSTMYRPQMAKMITAGHDVVLDPCAGWGGRMLGTVSNGAHYIAFEPNTETYSNLKNLAKFLEIESQVTLICDSALEMKSYNLPEVTCVLTSPPYFNLEVYTHEESQSINDCLTYSDWENKFLFPLIQLCIGKLSLNGVSCWNVAKVGKYDMWQSVRSAHAQLNYHESKEFAVQSSARQVNQSANKSKKSKDLTIQFELVSSKLS